MRLLITGSSGFVGSYFLRHYAKQYEINTFSKLDGDINALDLKSIDTVIHLAALVHQMGGASYEAYFQSNVTYTLELAKRAKEDGVKHFIFMSSVKVYGEESHTAYSETSECHPQDDYGKSKLEAEIALKTLEDDRFCISIIRTPVVYGWGVKANILNLVKLVKKMPLLPLGKIENRRSIVYVGNLAHLVDVLIQKKVSGIFLASDDEAFSTSGLIRLIAKALNKRLILIRVPLFETVLKKLKPSFHKRLYESLELDTKQTVGTLAYHNKYSSKEGINCMIYGEGNI